ncbi:MAG: flagellar protein FlaG [Bryobacterales bacterium]
MTIGEVQQVHASGIDRRRESPQGPGLDKAARNREVARAVRTLNEAQAVGANSELRFAVDRVTGESLIRIVDRATNEVITQVPPEATLRLAAVLRDIQEGAFIA